MRLPEFKPIFDDRPSTGVIPEKPVKIEDVLPGEENQIIEEKDPKEDIEKKEKEEQLNASREMADSLNSSLLKGLTLENNFNGDIVQITLPSAGTEIAVRHNLKVTPKYRIILKHKGDGIIQDGNTAWNSKTAYFKSSQATENITATILLMKA